MSAAVSTAALADEVSSTGLSAGQTTQAAAQASDTQPIEEIMVTGSRITRSGFNTPTPVTAVSANELANMNPGQLLDSISELPQFAANVEPQTSGFTGSGGSNLNLRGAGPNRTLVLLDGRRVVSSNRFNTVDVNTLPTALIKSVETVTGGASASYGSDAVAGVVNFILDTDFVGVKGQIQGGQTQYGDGQNWQASLAFGTDIGERGHFEIAGDIFRKKAIESIHKRHWFDQTSRITNPDPNGPTEIIRPYTEPSYYTNGGMIIQPGSALDHLQFNADGSATPYYFGGVGVLDSACKCQALDHQTYGVDSFDEVSPKTTHSSVFAYLDYDIADNVTVFAQGMFGSGYFDQWRDGPTLLGFTQAKIYSGNPYLPANVQKIMDDEALGSFGFDILGANDPNSPIGASRHRQGNKTYSGTLGIKAQINNDGFMDGWNVNGYYQYGLNRQDQRVTNGIEMDHMAVALDAVTDPATGSPVCYAALVNPDQFGSCAPIDLFGGVGNVSREAANYVIDKEKHNKAKVTQTFAELVLDGPIWEGLGAGPVSMALGASYRKDHFNQYTQDPCDEFVCLDDGTVTNDHGLIPENEPGGYPGIRFVPAGFKGDLSSSVIQFSSARTIGGGFNVKEIFTEFQVPLLANASFAQSLDTDLAVRYADYSGSGGIWAWKLGLDWQIVSSLRLRGTYSRDVRAATLAERYDQTRGNLDIQDPKYDNATATGASFSGGNENVSPEKADTYTVGAVLQPTFLPGFQASLDWYSINIKDAINQLSLQDIVDRCYEGATSLCQYVHRNPDTDRIDRVDALFINLNRQTIRGIDFATAYRADMELLGGGAESVSWRFDGTWLQENSLQNPGEPKDDQAGDIGASLPKLKFTTSLTYNNGPIQMFVQERWIGSGVINRTLTESAVHIDGVHTVDRNHVPQTWYTDLRLSYSIDTASGGSWQIYGNVTNLFNQAPPLVPTIIGRSGAESFNAGLYDTIGRRFVAGVRFNY